MSKSNIDPQTAEMYDNFSVLSLAIGELSRGLRQSVGDLVEGILVREKEDDHQVVISLKTTDSEGRAVHRHFALLQGDDLSLGMIKGKDIPKSWDIPLLHRDLIEFVKRLSNWPPVYGLQFCPFLKDSQRYTPADLATHKFLDGGRGWLLDIKGWSELNRVAA